MHILLDKQSRQEPLVAIVCLFVRLLSSRQIEAIPAPNDSVVFLLSSKETANTLGAIIALALERTNLRIGLLEHCERT